MSYREVTVNYPGFGTKPVSITILSSLAAGSVASREWTVLAFVAGALVLAFVFAILSSRALQAQVTRFLQAARRLGSGDFSAPVAMVGRDDFAALAAEFNHMSEQLDQRLQELTAQRAWSRESVRRIGQTCASNLDRPALMTLALQTAIDATESGWGWVTDGELVEGAGDGSIAAAEEALANAERAALVSEELGRGRQHDVDVLSVALRPHRHGSGTHGVLTLARRGGPYTEDESEMLRSLAGQAALAVENIDLHHQVSRQAVTDELTGLANHGRFQESLEAETEQVRRYHHTARPDHGRSRRLQDDQRHLWPSAGRSPAARCRSGRARESPPDGLAGALPRWGTRVNPASHRSRGRLRDRGTHPGGHRTARAGAGGWGRTA